MSRPRVQSLIKLTYWTFSVGSVYRRFGECLLSIRELFGLNSSQRHHFYLAVSNNIITFARQNNIMRMKTLRLLDAIFLK
jgi:hypothetical protein